MSNYFHWNIRKQRHLEFGFICLIDLMIPVQFFISRSIEAILLSKSSKVLSSEKNLKMRFQWRFLPLAKQNRIKSSFLSGP